MYKYVNAALSGALMLLCFSTLVFADIYKCTDDNGKVKYSPQQIKGLECNILNSSSVPTLTKLAQEDLYTKKFDPEKEALLATDIFKKENEYIQARSDLLTTGKSDFVEKELLSLGLEKDKTARQVFSGMIVDGAVSPELMKSVLQGYAVTGAIPTSIKNRYSKKPSPVDAKQKAATSSTREAPKLDSLYAFVNSYYRLVRNCQLEGNTFIEFIQDIEEMNPQLKGYLIDPSKITAIRKTETQCANENVTMPKQLAQPPASTGGYDNIFSPGGLFNPIHVIVH